MDLLEGQLRFSFPDAWTPDPSMPDDWAYYRKQYSRYFDQVKYICKKCRAGIVCPVCESKKTAGVRAVDIAAIDLARTVWLIEVKDYRFDVRTKAIDLADEIAIKVRDSLAMFLAAAMSANNANEKAMARAIVRASKICVVAHIEQPEKPSRLRPRSINLISVRDKLRRLLHFLDAHVLVVESSELLSLEWTVEHDN